MKKKLLAALLILALVLSLCACAAKETPESTSGRTEKKDPNSFRIGKAGITYVDFYIDKTPKGDDAIVLHYQYTNKGREAAPFVPGVSFLVSQGGTGLSAASVTTPDSDVLFVDDSLSVPVEPKETLDIYLSYILADFTTPVSVVFGNEDYSETHGQVVEISDYEFPEEPSQQETSEEPEPSEELCLGDQLVGKYARTDEYDELITLDIREAGGMLILEYGRWMEGEAFYDTWAEEFWPENRMDLESSVRNSIEGESLTFSVMSMAGNYWEGEKDRTLTLVGDELTLVYEEGSEEVFTRDPEEHEIHTLPEQQLQNLLDYYPSREETQPAGTWSFQDPAAGCILDLQPDGTFTAASKKQGQPITAITGAWGGSSEGDGLILLGEAAGYGQMPKVFQLDWTLDSGGNLLLKDTGDDSLLPFEGRLKFVPDIEAFDPELGETEAENAGGFLDEAPVSDGYQASGTYTDSFGSEYSYDFELPYLQGDTQNTRFINRAISDRFQGDIDEALASIEEEGGTALMEIGWMSGVYGGLVSILVAESYDYGFTEYEIYYYDAFNDEILEQDQVLEQMGISKDYFVSATRSAVQLYMEEESASLSAQEKEDYGYYAALDWTLSDENMRYENIRVFVNEDGDVGVILPVGSMAGADWYYRAVYPYF